ncbi:MAG: hypothetical protein ACKVQC_04790 [Elusimicrobiota bacterium]
MDADPSFTAGTPALISALLEPAGEKDANGRPITRDDQLFAARPAGTENITKVRIHIPMIQNAGLIRVTQEVTINGVKVVLGTKLLNTGNLNYENGFFVELDPRATGISVSAVEADGDRKEFPIKLGRVVFSNDSGSAVVNSLNSTLFGPAKVKITLPDGSTINQDREDVLYAPMPTQPSNFVRIQIRQDQIPERSIFGVGYFVTVGQEVNGIVYITNVINMSDGSVNFVDGFQVARLPGSTGMTITLTDWAGKATKFEDLKDLNVWLQAESTLTSGLPVAPSARFGPARVPQGLEEVEVKYLLFAKVPEGISATQGMKVRISEAPIDQGLLVRVIQVNAAGERFGSAYVRVERAMFGGGLNIERRADTTQVFVELVRANGQKADFPSPTGIVTFENGLSNLEKVNPLSQIAPTGEDTGEVDSNGLPIIRINNSLLFTDRPTNAAEAVAALVHLPVLPPNHFLYIAQTLANGAVVGTRLVSTNDINYVQGLAVELLSNSLGFVLLNSNFEQINFPQPEGSVEYRNSAIPGQLAGAEQNLFKPNKAGTAFFIKIPDLGSDAPARSIQITMPNIKSVENIRFVVTIEDIATGETYERVVKSSRLVSDNQFNYTIDFPEMVNGKRVVALSIIGPTGKEVLDAGKLIINGRFGSDNVGLPLDVEVLQLSESGSSFASPIPANTKTIIFSLSDIPNISTIRFLFTKVIQTPNGPVDQVVWATPEQLDGQGRYIVRVPAGVTGGGIIGFIEGNRTPQKLDPSILVFADFIGEEVASAILATDLAFVPNEVGTRYSVAIPLDAESVTVKLPNLPNADRVVFSFSQPLLDLQGNVVMRDGVVVKEKVVVTARVNDDGVFVVDVPRHLYPRIDGMGIEAYEGDSKVLSQIGQGDLIFGTTSAQDVDNMLAANIDVLKPLANGRGYFGIIRDGMTGMRLEVPSFTGVHRIRVMYTKILTDENGKEIIQPAFVTQELLNGGTFELKFPQGASGFAILGFAENSSVPLELGFDGEVRSFQRETTPTNAIKISELVLALAKNTLFYGSELPDNTRSVQLNYQGQLIGFSPVAVIINRLLPDGTYQPLKRIVFPNGIPYGTQINIPDGLGKTAISVQSLWADQPVYLGRSEQLIFVKPSALRSSNGLEFNEDLVNPLKVNDEISTTLGGIDLGRQAVNATNVLVRGTDPGTFVQVFQQVGNDIYSTGLIAGGNAFNVRLNPQGGAPSIRVMRYDASGSLIEIPLPSFLAFELGQQTSGEVMNGIEATQVPKFGVLNSLHFESRFANIPAELVANNGSFSVQMTNLPAGLKVTIQVTVRAVGSDPTTFSIQMTSEELNRLMKEGKNVFALNPNTTAISVTVEKPLPNGKTEPFPVPGGVTFLFGKAVPGALPLMPQAVGGFDRAAFELYMAIIHEGSNFVRENPYFLISYIYETTLYGADGDAVGSQVVFETKIVGGRIPDDGRNVIFRKVISTKYNKDGRSWHERWSESLNQIPVWQRQADNDRLRQQAESLNRLLQLHVDGLFRGMPQRYFTVDDGSIAPLPTNDPKLNFTLTYDNYVAWGGMKKFEDQFGIHEENWSQRVFADVSRHSLDDNDEMYIQPFYTWGKLGINSGKGVRGESGPVTMRVYLIKDNGEIVAFSVIQNMSGPTRIYGPLKGTKKIVVTIHEGNDILPQKEWSADIQIIKRQPVDKSVTVEDIEEGNRSLVRGSPLDRLNLYQLGQIKKIVQDNLDFFIAEEQGQLPKKPTPVESNTSIESDGTGDSALLEELKAQIQKYAPEMLVLLLTAILANEAARFQFKKKMDPKKEEPSVQTPAAPIPVLTIKELRKKRFKSFSKNLFAWTALGSFTASAFSALMSPEILPQLTLYAGGGVAMSVAIMKMWSERGTAKGRAPPPVSGLFFFVSVLIIAAFYLPQYIALPTLPQNFRGALIFVLVFAILIFGIYKYGISALKRGLKNAILIALLGGAGYSAWFYSLKLAEPFSFLRIFDVKTLNITPIEDKKTKKEEVLKPPFKNNLERRVEAERNGPLFEPIFKQNAPQQKPVLNAAEQARAQELEKVLAQFLKKPTPPSSLGDSKLKDAVFLYDHAELIDHLIRRGDIEKAKQLANRLLTGTEDRSPSKLKKPWRLINGVPAQAIYGDSGQIFEMEESFGPSLSLHMAFRNLYLTTGDSFYYKAAVNLLDYALQNQLASGEVRYATGYQNANPEYQIRFYKAARDWYDLFKDKKYELAANKALDYMFEKVPYQDLKDENKFNIEPRMFDFETQQFFIRDNQKLNQPKVGYPIDAKALAVLSIEPEKLEQKGVQYFQLLMKMTEIPKTAFVYEWLSDASLALDQVGIPYVKFNLERMERQWKQTASSIDLGAVIVLRNKLNELEKRSRELKDFLSKMPLQPEQKGGGLAYLYEPITDFDGKTKWIPAEGKAVGVGGMEFFKSMSGTSLISVISAQRPLMGAHRFNPTYLPRFDGLKALAQKAPDISKQQPLFGSAAQVTTEMEEATHNLKMSETIKKVAAHILDDGDVEVAYDRETGVITHRLRKSKIGTYRHDRYDRITGEYVVNVDGVQLQPQIVMEVKLEPGEFEKFSKLEKEGKLDFSYTGELGSQGFRAIDLKNKKAYMKWQVGWKEREVLDNVYWDPQTKKVINSRVLFNPNSPLSTTQDFERDMGNLVLFFELLGGAIEKDAEPTSVGYINEIPGLAALPAHPGDGNPTKVGKRKRFAFPLDPIRVVVIAGVPPGEIMKYLNQGLFAPNHQRVIDPEVRRLANKLINRLANPNLIGQGYQSPLALTLRASLLNALDPKFEIANGHQKHPALEGSKDYIYGLERELAQLLDEHDEFVNSGEVDFAHKKYFDQIMKKRIEILDTFRYDYFGVRKALYWLSQHEEALLKKKNAIPKVDLAAFSGAGTMAGTFLGGQKAAEHRLIDKELAKIDAARQLYWASVDGSQHVLVIGNEQYNRAIRYALGLNGRILKLEEKQNLDDKEKEQLKMLNESYAALYKIINLSKEQGWHEVDKPMDVVFSLGTQYERMVSNEAQELRRLLDLYAKERQGGNFQPAKYLQAIRALRDHSYRRRGVNGGQIVTQFFGVEQSRHHLVRLIENFLKPYEIDIFDPNFVANPGSTVAIARGLIKDGLIDANRLKKTIAPADHPFAPNQVTGALDNYVPLKTITLAGGAEFRWVRATSPNSGHPRLELHNAFGDVLAVIEGADIRISFGKKEENGAITTIKKPLLQNINTSREIKDDLELSVVGTNIILTLNTFTPNFRNPNGASDIISSKKILLNKIDEFFSRFPINMSDYSKERRGVRVLETTLFKADGSRVTVDDNEKRTDEKFSPVSWQTPEKFLKLKESLEGETVTFPGPYVKNPKTFRMIPSAVEVKSGGGKEVYTLQFDPSKPDVPLVDSEGRVVYRIDYIIETAEGETITKSEDRTYDGEFGHLYAIDDLRYRQTTFFDTKAARDHYLAHGKNYDFKTKLVDEKGHALVFYKTNKIEVDKKGNWTRATELWAYPQEFYGNSPLASSRSAEMNAFINDKKNEIKIPESGPSNIYWKVVNMEPHAPGLRDLYGVPVSPVVREEDPFHVVVHEKSIAPLRPGVMGHGSEIRRLVYNKRGDNILKNEPDTIYTSASFRSGPFEWKGELTAKGLAMVLKQERNLMGGYTPSVQWHNSLGQRVAIDRNYASGPQSTPWDRTEFPDFEWHAPSQQWREKGAKNLTRVTNAADFQTGELLPDRLMPVSTSETVATLDQNPYVSGIPLRGKINESRLAELNVFTGGEKYSWKVLTDGEHPVVKTRTQVFAENGNRNTVDILEFTPQENSWQTYGVGGKDGKSTQFGVPVGDENWSDRFMVAIPVRRASGQGWMDPNLDITVTIKDKAGSDVVIGKDGNMRFSTIGEMSVNPQFVRLPNGKLAGGGTNPMRGFSRSLDTNKGSEFLFITVADLTAMGLDVSQIASIGVKMDSDSQDPFVYRGDVIGFQLPGSQVGLGVPQSRRVEVVGGKKVLTPLTEPVTVHHGSRGDTTVSFGPLRLTENGKWMRTSQVFIHGQLTQTNFPLQEGKKVVGVSVNHLPNNSPGYSGPVANITDLNSGWSAGVYAYVYNEKENTVIFYLRDNGYSGAMKLLVYDISTSQFKLDSKGLPEQNLAAIFFGTPAGFKISSDTDTSLAKLLTPEGAQASVFANLVGRFSVGGKKENRIAQLRGPVLPVLVSPASVEEVIGRTPTVHPALTHAPKLTGENPSVESMRHFERNKLKEENIDKAIFDAYVARIKKGGAFKFIPPTETGEKVKDLVTPEKLRTYVELLAKYGTKEQKEGFLKEFSTLIDDANNPLFDSYNIADAQPKKIYPEYDRLGNAENVIKAQLHGADIAMQLWLSTNDPKAFDLFIKCYQHLVRFQAVEKYINLETGKAEYRQGPTVPRGFVEWQPDAGFEWKALGRTIIKGQRVPDGNEITSNALAMMRLGEWAKFVQNSLGTAQNSTVKTSLQTLLDDIQARRNIQQQWLIDNAFAHARDGSVPERVRETRVPEGVEGAKTPEGPKGEITLKDGTKKSVQFDFYQLSRENRTNAYSSLYALMAGSQMVDEDGKTLDAEDVSFFKRLKAMVFKKNLKNMLLQVAQVHGVWVEDKGIKVWGLTPLTPDGSVDVIDVRLTALYVQVAHALGMDEDEMTKIAKQALNAYSKGKGGLLPSIIGLAPESLNNGVRVGNDIYYSNSEVPFWPDTFLGKDKPQALQKDPLLSRENEPKVWGEDLNASDHVRKALKQEPMMTPMADEVDKEANLNIDEVSRLQNPNFKVEQLKYDSTRGRLITAWESLENRLFSQLNGATLMAAIVALFYLIVTLWNVGTYLLSMTMSKRGRFVGPLVTGTLLLGMAVTLVFASSVGLALIPIFMVLRAIGKRLFRVSHKLDEYDVLPPEMVELLQDIYDDRAQKEGKPLSAEDRAGDKLIHRFVQEKLSVYGIEVLGIRKWTYKKKENGKEITSSLNNYQLMWKVVDGKNRSAAELSFIYNMMISYLWLQLLSEPVVIERMAQSQFKTTKLEDATGPPVQDEQDTDELDLSLELDGNASYTSFGSIVPSKEQIEKMLAGIQEFFSEKLLDLNARKRRPETPFRIGEVDTKALLDRSDQSPVYKLLINQFAALSKKNPEMNREDAMLKALNALRTNSFDWLEKDLAVLYTRLTTAQATDLNAIEEILKKELSDFERDYSQANIALPVPEKRMSIVLRRFKNEEKLWKHFQRNANAGLVKPTYPERESLKERELLEKVQLRASIQDLVKRYPKDAAIDVDNSLDFAQKNFLKKLLSLWRPTSFLDHLKNRREKINTDLNGLLGTPRHTQLVEELAKIDKKKNDHDDYVARKSAIRNELGLNLTDEELLERYREEDSLEDRLKKVKGDQYLNSNQKTLIDEYLGITENIKDLTKVSTKQEQLVSSLGLNLSIPDLKNKYKDIPSVNADNSLTLDQRELLRELVAMWNALEQLDDDWGFFQSRNELKEKYTNFSELKELAKKQKRPLSEQQRRSLIQAKLAGDDSLSPEQKAALFELTIIWSGTVWMDDNALNKAFLQKNYYTETRKSHEKTTSLVYDDMEFYWLEIRELLRLAFSDALGLPKERGGDEITFDQAFSRMGFVEREKTIEVRSNQNGRKIQKNVFEWTYDQNTFERKHKEFRETEPNSSLGNNSTNGSVKLMYHLYFHLFFAGLLIAVFHGVGVFGVDPIYNSLPKVLNLAHNYYGTMIFVVAIAGNLFIRLVTYGRTTNVNRAKAIGRWGRGIFSLIGLAGLFLIDSRTQDVGIIRLVLMVALGLEALIRLRYNQSLFSRSFIYHFPYVQRLSFRSILTSHIRTIVFFIFVIGMGLTVWTFFTPSYNLSTSPGQLLSMAGLVVTFILASIIRHFDWDWVDNYLNWQGRMGSLKRIVFLGIGVGFIIPVFIISGSSVAAWVIAAIGILIVIAFYNPSWMSSNARDLISKRYYYLRNYDPKIITWIGMKHIFTIGLIVQFIVSQVAPHDTRLMVATASLISIMILSRYALRMILTVIAGVVQMFGEFLMEPFRRDQVKLFGWVAAFIPIGTAILFFTLLGASKVAVWSFAGFAILVGLYILVTAINGLLAYIKAGHKPRWAWTLGYSVLPIILMLPLFLVFQGEYTGAKAGVSLSYYVLGFFVSVYLLMALVRRIMIASTAIPYPEGSIYLDLFAGLDPIKSTVFDPAKGLKGATDDFMRNVVIARKNRGRGLQSLLIANRKFFDEYTRANNLPSLFEPVGPLAFAMDRVLSKLSFLGFRPIFVRLNQKEINGRVAADLVLEYLLNQLHRKELDVKMTLYDPLLQLEKSARHFSLNPNGNMSPAEKSALNMAFQLRYLIAAQYGETSMDTAVSIAQYYKYWATLPKDKRANNKFLLPNNFGITTANPENPDPESIHRSKFLEFINFITTGKTEDDFVKEKNDPRITEKTEKVAFGVKVGGDFASKAIAVQGLMISFVQPHQLTVKDPETGKTQTIEVEGTFDFSKVAHTLIWDRNMIYDDPKTMADEKFSVMQDQNISLVFPDRDSALPAGHRGGGANSMIALMGEGGASSVQRAIYALNRLDTLGCGWSTSQGTSFMYPVMVGMMNPQYPTRPMTRELVRTGRYNLMKKKFGAVGGSISLFYQSEDYLGSILGDQGQSDVGRSIVRRMWRFFSLKAREGGPHYSINNARLRWVMGLFQLLASPFVGAIDIFSGGSFFDKEGRADGQEYYLLGPVIYPTVTLMGVLILRNWTPFVGIDALWYLFGFLAMQILAAHGILRYTRLSGLLLGGSLGAANFAKGVSVYASGNNIETVGWARSAVLGTDYGLAFQVSLQSELGTDSTRSVIDPWTKEGLSPQSTPQQREKLLAPIIYWEMIISGFFYVSLYYFALIQLNIINVVMLALPLMIVTSQFLAPFIHDNVTGEKGKLHWMMPILGFITAFLFNTAIVAEIYGHAGIGNALGGLVLTAVLGAYTVFKAIPRGRQGKPFSHLAVIMLFPSVLLMLNVISWPWFFVSLAAMVALFVLQFVWIVVTQTIILMLAFVLGATPVINKVFPSIVEFLDNARNLGLVEDKAGYEALSWRAKLGRAIVKFLVANPIRTILVLAMSVILSLVALLLVMNNWFMIQIGAQERKILTAGQKKEEDDDAKKAPPSLWLLNMFIDPSLADDLAGGKKEEIYSRYLTVLTRSFVANSFRLMWFSIAAVAGVVSYNIGNYLFVVQLKEAGIAAMLVVVMFVFVLVVGIIVSYFLFQNIKHRLTLLHEQYKQGQGTFKVLTREDLTPENISRIPEVQNVFEKLLREQKIKNKNIKDILIDLREGRNLGNMKSDDVLKALNAPIEAADSRAVQISNRIYLIQDNWDAHRFIALYMQELFSIFSLKTTTVARRLASVVTLGVVSAEKPSSFTLRYRILRALLLATLAGGLFLTVIYLVWPVMLQKWGFITFSASAGTGTLGMGLLASAPFLFITNPLVIAASVVILAWALLQKLAILPNTVSARKLIQDPVVRTLSSNEKNRIVLIRELNNVLKTQPISLGLSSIKNNELEKTGNNWGDISHYAHKRLNQSMTDDQDPDLVQRVRFNMARNIWNLFMRRDQTAEEKMLAGSMESIYQTTKDITPDMLLNYRFVQSSKEINNSIAFARRQQTSGAVRLQKEVLIANNENAYNYAMAEIAKMPGLAEHMIVIQVPYQEPNANFKQIEAAVKQARPEWVTTVDSGFSRVFIPAWLKQGLNDQFFNESDLKRLALFAVLNDLMNSMVVQIAPASLISNLDDVYNLAASQV